MASPTTESDGIDQFNTTIRNTIFNPDRLYRTLFYVTTLFITLFVIFPFYFLFVLAITPEFGVGEVRYFPVAFEFGNFVETLELIPMHWYVFNSIAVASVATLLVLTIGSLAGYVFGRLQFRGRIPLLFLFLVITYFPGTTFLIPLFRLFTGAVDVLGVQSPDVFGTIWPLVLPLSGITLPLAIFILTIFFSQIPDGIEDAARIEGDSRLGALYRVIIPLSAPGFVTAGILTFILVYNDFFFSVLLTDGSIENWAPLVHGILSYQETVVRGTPHHLIAAGSLLGLIPVAILVFFGQKKIVSGLTTGALKE